MEKLTFKTNVQMELKDNSTKYYFLKKEGGLEESTHPDTELDVDFTLDMDGIRQKSNRGTADVEWSIEVYAVRDNHVNLKIGVKDQEMSGSFDLDAEYLVDGDKYELDDAVKGWSKFDLNINLSDISVNYENIKHNNPFVDDFCPSLIKLNLNKLIQVDKYTFRGEVSDVELIF